MAKPKSKTYNPAETEKRIFDGWQKGGHFHPEPDERDCDHRFCMVIPPPNVTGALHLGHALNNTLQDILVRQKRMAGNNTFWLLGTDHAGIATQATVEKTIIEQEKKNRHDLGREELVRRIWEWKERFGGRIVEQLKLMGCSCDYERERFTLDDGCAKAVRHTFFKLFRDGLIYRGKRLVNWDTQLQTAVADDEVYHEAVKGHFYHFKYPIIDPEPGEPEFVHIATTRPETMLADTAVAVHPEPGKALDKAEKEARARLAESPEKEKAALRARIEDIAERRAALLPTLLKLRDMAKAGRTVRLPLVDRPIPLICDEWADPTLGSGCVKITPAHDSNDYEVGQRHDLPMVNVMTDDGKIARIVEPDGQVNPKSGDYEGLRFATKGRQKVVADLEALGLVEKIEDRAIDLGHSDRSKTAIEPFLSDQWFVKMGDVEPEHAAKIEGLRNGARGLVQMAIDAICDNDEHFGEPSARQACSKVHIFPRRYAKSYIDWLSEKRDWCISRQLWWGHRIPVWRLKGTITEQRAILLNQRFTLWAKDGLLANASSEKDSRFTGYFCPHPLIEKEFQEIAETNGFQQEPDVLDTWFSSALWPHSTLGWPDDDSNNEDNILGYFYPTSVLSTAREIITLWVARMVITGLYNAGKVPFRDVVIHPVIQDGQGRKMSKTLGNGVDPVDLIDEYGADAMRFTLADLATETQDIRMPVQTKKLPDGRTINISPKFEKGRNFCNKLWQAATGFVIPNLEGYEPVPLDPATLELEDRWILSRMTACQQDLDRALQAYRFSDAVNALYRFMWDEYCSWYIEMSKPRLAGGDRSRVQQVLVYVLDRLLRMLHPIVPFVTEALWELLAKSANKRGLRNITQPEPALVTAQWPTPENDLRDPDVEAEMHTLHDTIRSIREIRTTVNARRGHEKKPAIRSLPRAIIRVDRASAQLLESKRDFVTLLAGCDLLEIGADVQKPKGALGRIDGAVQVYVPVDDLVELSSLRDDEKAELTRQRAAYAREESRLANPGFVQRADPEVVEQARRRASELSRTIQLLEQHVADLG